MLARIRDHSVTLPDGNKLRLDTTDHRIYITDNAGNTIGALTNPGLGDPRTKIADIGVRGDSIFVLSYNAQDPSSLALTDLQGKVLQKFSNLPGARISGDGTGILSREGKITAISVDKNVTVDNSVHLPPKPRGGCNFVRLDEPGPWGMPNGADPKKWRGSMEKVPLEVQNNRTCYANAAARMVDAYRFSHLPPEGDTNYFHLSSPFMATLGTRLSEPKHREQVRMNLQRNAYDGDLDVCDTVDYLRQNGSCDRRDAEEMHGPEEGDGLIRDFFKKNMVSQFLADYAASESEAGGDCKGQKISILTPLLGGVDPEDILTHAILNAWCPRKINVNPKIECEHLPTNSKANQILEPDPSPNNVQGTLDMILDGKGPIQPIDILFCGGTLVGDDRCDLFTSHHALVVGRRWTSIGACEYLIQDSYECSGYSHECEDGKTWINIDDFKETVFDIAHIK